MNNNRLMKFIDINICLTTRKDFFFIYIHLIIILFYFIKKKF